MADFNEIQDELNKEHKQKKRDELKTSAGFKKAVSEKVAAFVSKLLMRKSYQAVFGIILAYILITGLIYVFINLFTMFTPIVITLCLLVIFWDNIKLERFNLQSQSYNDTIM